MDGNLMSTNKNNNWPTKRATFAFQTIIRFHTTIEWRITLDSHLRLRYIMISTISRFQVENISSELIVLK